MRWDWRRKSKEKSLCSKRKKHTTSLLPKFSEKYANTIYVCFYDNRNKTLARHGGTHSLIPACWRKKQADLCEVEASLVSRSKFQDSEGYTEKPCLGGGKKGRKRRRKKKQRKIRKKFVLQMEV